jgi:uncharacterized protein (TIGR02147 family)
MKKQIQTKIREALTASQIRNPNYSLRAFARTLDLSPSAVHEILNGKRNFSPKLAKKILEKLHTPPHEIEATIAALTKIKKQKGELDSEKNLASEHYARLSQDQFSLISEWYHFAILSLAETQDFQSEPSWIAKRLGITLTQTTEAISRLERLGMLLRNPVTHTLTCTGQSFSTTDEIKNLAVRKSHHQMIELACRSLEQDQVTERDFTTYTLAIDPDRLPEAKRRIRNFSVELMQFLESGPKKTQVHALCIQTFPLSKREDKT